VCEGSLEAERVQRIHEMPYWHRAPLNRSLSAVGEFFTEVGMAKKPAQIVMGALAEAVWWMVECAETDCAIHGWVRDIAILERIHRQMRRNGFPKKDVAS
jgi:hypothetical protein